MRICNIDSSTHGTIIESLPARLFAEESIVEAPAKINVRLKVLGRRSDGYHLLSMLNVSVSLYDSLRVRLTREAGVLVALDPADVLDVASKDNLVARAFNTFWSELGFDSAPIGLSVHLTKRIPIGAGLGGGSSDAGAVFRFLEQEVGPGLQTIAGIDPESLRGIVMRAASKVGADVPYAYQGGACWVTGVGDVVASLTSGVEWPGEVLIVVPPAAVSTLAFYNFYRKRVPHIVNVSDEAMEHFAALGGASLPPDLIENDFESAVSVLCPEVGRALEVARAFFPATTSLTGSGAAIFSLVPPGDEGQVEEFCSEISSENMTVHRVRIVG